MNLQMVIAVFILRLAAANPMQSANSTKTHVSILPTPYRSPRARARKRPKGRKTCRASRNDNSERYIDCDRNHRCVRCHWNLCGGGSGSDRRDLREEAQAIQEKSWKRKRSEKSKTLMDA